MKITIKISVICAITILFILFGISQYAQKRKIVKEPIYTTRSGNIIIGVMASDKDKLESFKRDLDKDKDDPFNRYLDVAYSYKDKGDYEKAIQYGERALKIAVDEMGSSPQYMVRDILAKLYEKTGKYDNAIKEFETAIKISPRGAVDAIRYIIMIYLVKNDIAVHDKEIRAYSAF